MSRARENIAANVRRLRLAVLLDGYPMSQEQLAQKAGLNAQTVWRVEAGLTAPSWETVHLLGEALGVTPTSLTEDPPAKKP